MCGIVGFTAKNWFPDHGRIQDATGVLSHRGPDQQGVFRSKVCSLGATRLKIVDLTSGNQPLLSEDGGTVIVFNGEIYNHLEIRRQLESLGRGFRTHCDTETVLQAFLEWGTDCFSRFRGMFALAIWSNEDQRLLLARDRLGIKPLYIAESGDDLFFASELKGILIHPEIARYLSLEGLDCYLSMNYVPCPWTLIDGIKKLPPGRWLEWQYGRTKQHSYWELPAIRPREISFEDAKAELDLLLDEAVREHLMSDVPLGVWLSGGVDSSTILHYAAQASNRRLRTFSISFAGRSFDETEYIQQVVKHYGTEHSQINLSPEDDLEQAIQSFAYYSDEPSADSGALPVWFLSKLTKISTTVAFSGEGADELFGGYLTYRANRIAANINRVPKRLIDIGLGGLKMWPVSSEKISLEYQLKRLLQGSRLPPEQAHVYWNGTFSEEEKALLLRIRLPGTFSDTLTSLRSSLPGDGIAPFLEFDQRYYLPDDILVKSDRMSMAYAVEVRPPFLDHRIVEFAATLPSAFKVSGTRQKLVLKELMKSRLPASIVQRKKIGFDIPAHDWLRGALRPMMMESLASAELKYSELFNFEVIRNYVQLHLDRRINIGYHLWGLIILFLWMKQWKVQPEPSLKFRKQTLALEL